MNSMNHYSYGAIVEWVCGCAAGFSALEPGFARARIAPYPNWGLRVLDYELDSAAGTYGVAWECVDEGHLRVAITVPFGAVAEVELPFAPDSAYDDLGGHKLVSGSYEVIYATTRSLRRVPSAEWTIAQILDAEDASSVVRRFVDGFDWSMMQADPTQTLREAQAAGLGQNRRMTTEELAACDAALRALAE
jgi:alpha-L-rhamnosidase